MHARDASPPRHRRASCFVDMSLGAPGPPRRTEAQYNSAALQTDMHHSALHLHGLGSDGGTWQSSLLVPPASGW